MKAKSDNSNEEVYLLKEPIVFKIILDDELLEAKIVSVKNEYEYENEDEEYDDDIIPYWTQLFNIQFSNGHFGEYYVDDEEVFTDGQQDKYTNALQVEISSPLDYWSKHKPVYTMFWPIDGKETTIWVYNIGSNRVPDYFVDYKNEFRFRVKFENDQWKAVRHRGEGFGPVDEPLADKVISLLKYYHAQPLQIVQIPNPYVKPKKPRSKCNYPVGFILDVPIRFFITVKGELLEARIIAVRYEYHGFEYEPKTWHDTNWFIIKFSNGHEDEYSFEEETCTDRGRDIYTDALQKEVYQVLDGWNETSTVYTLGWPIDGVETNIWVYRVGLSTYFDYFVVYNSDYRFTVIFENDQWTTLTIRKKDPEIIDPALAKKVIAMLKHYRKAK